MQAAIIHRGPDEGGHHLADGVAMAMRRLNIIDVAGSHQPVQNEDGSVVAVFNGEIFNFRDLREDLVRRGHVLKTRGDTETIVHLYEEHGPGFVTHLRGMFAIALWDATRRRLLLVRDRLGVKPLYWTRNGDRLAFASEVKSLIAGGVITPELDPVAAQLFLTLGYVPAPRTLFKDVFKQHPATIIEWRDGVQSSPWVYWRPEDPPPVSPASWQEDEENLRHLIRKAVHDRMVSDVPLGVMLSGGLDSSLITALMAEVSPQVTTFAVGFEEDGDSNELGWARRVAQRLGTEHHERMTRAADLWSLFDEALWHLEEPIADLSFLGLLELSRLAREHVTVALCGQAADELLAGYPKYLVARLTQFTDALPAGVRGVAATTARRLDGRTPVSRVLQAIGAGSDVERLLALSRVVPVSALSALLREDDAGALEAELQAALQEFSPGRPRDSALSRLISLDVRLSLPDLMFLYFDKMSMATSLEIRVPFADHDVVNFCMALADNRRVRLPNHQKDLLRRASRGLVDDAILNRPKGRFFRAASTQWLERSESAVTDLLHDSRTRSRGIYDGDTVRQWLDMPRRGSRAAEPLLSLFLLEKWHRVFVDPDGPALAGRARVTPAPAPQLG